jgi:hypothetical protein
VVGSYKSVLVNSPHEGAKSPFQKENCSLKLGLLMERCKDYMLLSMLEVNVSTML